MPYSPLAKSVLKKQFKESIECINKALVSKAVPIGDHIEQIREDILLYTQAVRYLVTHYVLTSRVKAKLLVALWSLSDKTYFHEIWTKAGVTFDDVVAFVAFLDFPRKMRQLIKQKKAVVMDTVSDRDDTHLGIHLTSSVARTVKRWFQTVSNDDLVLHYLYHESIGTERDTIEKLRFVIDTCHITGTTRDTSSMEWFLQLLLKQSFALKRPFAKPTSTSSRTDDTENNSNYSYRWVPLAGCGMADTVETDSSSHRGFAPYPPHSFMA